MSLPDKNFLSYGPLGFILYLLKISGSTNYLSAIKSAKKLGIVKLLEKLPINHDCLSAINVYLYVIVQENNIEEILKEFKVIPAIQKKLMEHIQQVRSKWMERGRKEGIEKGLFLGIEKGKKKEKLEIAQALRKQGIDIKIIKNVTGLSEIDIQKY